MPNFERYPLNSDRRHSRRYLCLIATTQENLPCAGLRRREQPGARADIFDGKSRPEGKKYSARRLLPRRDFEEVQTSLALAKAYWECSRPVVLHEELPWDLPATKSLVVNALRQVPHYHDITDADVYQDAFRIAELSSWCIRQDKLSPSEEIVAEMRKQGTSTSSPTLICSNRPTTILLPPVIEIHDDVRAVMDGTHRLWHLYRGDPNARATVLVVAVSVPLPGVPHLFTKLPYFRVQLDRNSDITAYKAEYWRSFTPMEMFLRSEGEQYLAGPVYGVSIGHLAPPSRGCGRVASVGRSVTCWVDKTMNSTRGNADDTHTYS